MPQLSEVVTISKRRESRRERLVPWSEFEPLLSRLRQALDASQNEACQYVGYSGGTMITTWRNEGVPIVAVNAFKWALHDLGQPALAPKAPRVFTPDELGNLLNAVLGNPVRDAERAALIAKIAGELAR